MRFRVSALLAVTAAVLSFSSVSYAGTANDPTDKMAELGLTQEGKPLPVAEKTSIIPEKPVVSLLVLDKMSGEHELVRVDRPADFESRSLAEQADCVLNLLGKADPSYILPGMTYDGTVSGENKQTVECRFTLPAMSDYNGWACGDGTGLGNFLTDALFANLGENLTGVKVTFRKSASDEYRTVSAYMDKAPVMPQELFDDAEDGAVTTVSSPEKQGALNTLSNGARPTGQLTGKAVYFNQGHGKVWRGTTWQAFSYQRGFVQENMEDMSNADLFNNFVTPYVWQAGADTYSVRETDPNPNMVIVDNDDTARTDGYGFSKTGTWTGSSITGFKNGASPYASGTDPFSLGTQLLAACTTGASPTATATWAAQIPAAGWYNVYVSHAAYTNRASAAKYQVFHAGGVTDVTIDQRRWRNTWVLLGRFYFEKNAPAAAAKVVLSNVSGSASDYVAADAVRFGGGKGVVKRGTAGTSGEARYNEEARYHLQFCGVPETGTYGYNASTAADTDTQVDEKDGWTARPRYAKWMLYQSTAYGASAQNSCMVAGHTNAFDTTARGFGTYRSSSSTANDVTAFQATLHPAIYNDLKGIFSGMSSSRGQYEGAYGENNPDSAGMPVMLGEWIFHDNTADMTLYHHPRFRQTLARGIMRGIINYWASKGTASRIYPPEPITNLCVLQESPTSVRLTWGAPATSINGYAVASAATGYRIWKSEHGRAFPNALATMTAPASGVPTYLVTGLTPGKTYYFKVTATNAGGESQAGDTLAVRTETASNAKKVLIVQGFNKLDPSTRVKTTYSGGTLYRQYLDRMNTYDYIFEHMKGIDAYCAATNRPIKVNSCNKDSINGQWVLLSGYDAVIWMSGIEAEVATWDIWNDVSIDSNSRTYITNYLNTPKKAFFISGSEVAWEMVSKNVAPTFLTGTLKTGFTSDGSGVFTVSPVAGSIFAGIAGNIALDTGSDLTRVGYQVQWPDVLNIPSGSGASAALAYGAGTSGSTAATQYGNENTARVVFMGFPLEAIVNDASRNAVMSNTMKFLLPTGSVRVDISPASAASAGAQWSIDDGTTWNNSGVTLSNVDVGACTVSFKSVAGWVSPANQSVTVSSTAPVTATGTYVSAGAIGNLQVNIVPAGAVTAGAQWAVDGGAWHDSGAVVSGLTVGTKTVSFKSVANWLAPSNLQVNVTDGGTAVATGTYTALTGSLTVTLTPEDAVADGAQWSIDAGATWNTSGATLTGLVPGSKTIVYKSLTNWISPPNASVVIAAGQTATATGNYQMRPLGAIQGFIVPNEAAVAGGKWSIDGTNWYNHGDTVGSLTPGDYSVYFSYIYGWEQPGAVTVSVLPNTITPATGTYVQQTARLSVVISPQSAVNQGAKWTVNGKTHVSEETADVPVGIVTVEFADIPGWTTPAPLQINTANGEILQKSAEYLQKFDINLVSGDFSSGVVTPLVPGSPVDISWTLHSSSAEASAFWCEVFASKTGGFDQVRFGSTVTNSYVQNGTDGTTQTLAPTNQILKTLPDGVYSLMPVVNRYAVKTIDEWNFVNNWTTIAGKRLRVRTQTAATADLKMTSSTFVISSTDPEKVTVTATVRNEGAMANNQCWLEVFYGNPTMEGTLDPKGTVSPGTLIPTLNSGMEMTFTQQGWVSGGVAQYALAAIADSTDIVPESNEVNNSIMWSDPSIVPVPPQNGVDLAITGMSVVPSLLAPNQAAPGTLFNCTVNVKNNGSAVTGCWLEIFGSQDGGVSFMRGSGLVDGLYVTPPAPGAEQTYSFANVPIKAIGDGMYTPVAVVNRYGVPGNPGDQNPSDNRYKYAGGRISLSTPSQSGTVNLVWSEGPTFTQTDTLVTVTGKVKNTGSAASSAFWTEAFTGKIDEHMGFFTRDADVFAGGVLCQGLAPGAEQTVTVSGYVTPGQIVGILTDSTDLIAETDETDNYDYSELTQ